MEPAIPAPCQIRRMPATSVKALCKALARAGLRVRPGGAHLRVETAAGVLIGTVPNSPSDRHSLLNTRSDLARRVERMREQHGTSK